MADGGKKGDQVVRYTSQQIKQNLASLRNPSWCYDSADQQFQYVAPDVAEMAASVIESLGGELARLREAISNIVAAERVGTETLCMRRLKEAEAVLSTEPSMPDPRAEKIERMRGVLVAIVEIDSAGGTALLSNQGQGMDGYSKLANYDAVAKRARQELAFGGGW